MTGAVAEAGPDRSDLRSGLLEQLREEYQEFDED